MNTIHKTLPCLFFPHINSFFSKHKHWRFNWASLVPQVVKNPPAVWKTWGQSLGWEDPLEEGMETHANIFAWKIPMDRGVWWATAHGVTNSGK